MADYKVSVYIKDCGEVFKEGLDKGVISTCIVSLPEDETPTSIAITLHQVGSDMVKECVDFKYEKVDK